MSKIARFQERHRLKAVVDAIGDTVEKLRGEIEELQANGGQPHDYSLGFTNGLIFAQHNLLGQPGRPKFYMQKTSIGELPRPIRFEQNPDDHREILEQQEYQRLIDDILYAVEKMMAAEKSGELCGHDLGSWGVDLESAYGKYEAFMKEQEKKKEDGTCNQLETPGVEAESEVVQAPTDVGSVPEGDDSESPSETDARTGDGESEARA